MSIKNNLINVYEYISIYDLSLILNINYQKIIDICLSLGIIVTMNYRLNKELIILICDDLGYNVNILKIKKNIKINKLKKNFIRPPIVTIMGHVDHGKTSLLDYIRKVNTISKEFGNITQKINIFNVKFNNKKSITFIDTPGHESFSSMRYRGLKITDIALIIISSDNGIMKQTLECINSAKFENLPMIFVFTKIDKKNSNVNKIKEELSNLNILVKDWGGDYLSQEISVKNGIGINKLIKKIFLISKRLNLITDLNILSYGIIIESFLDKNKGYIVKLIVLNGILKIGDYIISGIYYGKIKNIYNNKNLKINKVFPSYPAYVVGFNGAPNSGDNFNVLNTLKEIQEIYNKKKILIEKHKLKINNNNINNNKFNFIIKGDVNGTIDVILDEINKLSQKNKIFINIVNKSVGNITKSDILLANATNSLIIGFNVKLIINKKDNIYNNKNKNIYIFNLIYDLIDFLKKIINKKEEDKKKILSYSKVIKIFKKQNKIIFGCIVKKGKINKKDKIIILRNKKIIHYGNIVSIKRFNKDVNEVIEGYDYGLIIKNFNLLKINDIIKSYL